MALGQLRASLVVEMVKNPPAMWDTWVRSLGQEDPLEEGRAPIPVFLPGEFQAQRRLAGYNPRDGDGSDTTEATKRERKPD